MEFMIPSHVSAFWSSSSGSAGSTAGAKASWKSLMGFGIWLPVSGEFSQEMVCGWWILGQLKNITIIYNSIFLIIPKLDEK